MTADDVLRQLWFKMMNDASETAMGRTFAVIDAFKRLGLFDADKAELWRLRIRDCPGGHSGGRVWCAYCGDLTRDDQEENLFI